MDQDLPVKPRSMRSDGEQSRERLLHAALRLFAHQGYERTSTREIAEAAAANVAAISYYFGDKAGLYKAVFFGASGLPAGAGVSARALARLSLAQVLCGPQRVTPASCPALWGLFQYMGQKYNNGSSAGAEQNRWPVLGNQQMNRFALCVGM